jgi:hypothetical protein
MIGSSLNLLFFMSAILLVGGPLLLQAGMAGGEQVKLGTRHQEIITNEKRLGRHRRHTSNQLHVHVQAATSSKYS